jgi:hypothetical protein
MRPRLQPFGTDFGNGEADRRYFQRDDLEAVYLAAKRGRPRERYRVAAGSPREDAAHDAVLAWCGRTLASERPDLRLELSGRFGDRYAAISDAVQEDFVVQLRDADGRDRAIAVYVCFPSSWRPERILGWSFQEIHAPVPDFADEAVAARSLVAAMVERGPYVRFVWTLVAHGMLDHHPDDGPGGRFEAGAREGWLRVERQVTVPFPGAQASLFLIRTYLYRFDELPDRERAILAEAIRRMPEASARYKGIEGRREHILGALAHA